MKFIEESYARDLHRKLSDHLGVMVPDATVTLTGAGVHWDCIIVRGERRCSVHCFDVKGPEYLTSFEHRKQLAAMGRTADKTDTIAALIDWIGGYEISELHARYDFIDRQKRSLESIVAQTVRVCPELESADRELKQQICDLYELWFQEQDRSCRVSYYGKNQYPDATFHWDECRIFAVQTGDFNHLALLLKRWLCDHVAPSALQTEFPAIELGKVARYYEDGRGIEGEFIESWDRIEKFYAEMNFPPVAAIRALIVTIRELGYDRTLRAGQSMYTLVLSRSRRHGLRQGQPHLAIQFSERGMEVCPNNLGGANLTLPKVALTDDVEAMLRQLANVTID